MGLLPAIADRLAYEPETGEFRWKSGKPRGSAKVGGLAGTVHTSGRKYVRVDGRTYLAHRLAWALTHGEWPRGEIDHIDGNNGNNALANLRDVDHHVNMQNLRAAKADNSCGSLGVYQIKSSGRWRAQIKAVGVKKHIGCYATRDEAAAAYLTAKRKHHDGCTI